MCYSLKRKFLVVGSGMPINNGTCSAGDRLNLGFNVGNKIGWAIFFLVSYKINFIFKILFNNLDNFAIKAWNADHGSEEDRIGH